MNSETNEEVAIKKVGNAFDNHIDAKRTLREIKLLRHMDHENVRMRDAFYQYPPLEFGHFWCCDTGLKSLHLFVFYSKIL